MRHNKSFNHLGRQSGHRKAMLSNMASSLIINKRIETTVAKAKALKMFVEPLVTKSKDDSTHSRRVAILRTRLLPQSFSALSHLRSLTVPVDI